MGDIRGFMKHDRELFEKEATDKRVKHWDEFSTTLPDDKLRDQGARCPRSPVQ